MVYFSTDVILKTLRSALGLFQEAVSNGDTLNTEHFIDSGIKNEVKCYWRDASVDPRRWL